LQRRLRTEVFLREVIPWWLAPLGYGGLGVLSTIFIPMIYPPVKWYYVMVAYIISPLFALPNSYGECGDVHGVNMAVVHGVKLTPACEVVLCCGGIHHLTSVCAAQLIR
jgi:hypothetical protein